MCRGTLVKRTILTGTYYFIELPPCAAEGCLWERLPLLHRGHVGLVPPGGGKEGVPAGGTAQVKETWGNPILSLTCTLLKSLHLEETCRLEKGFCSDILGFPSFCSHDHVDRVFFYGREYHIMPRILLHGISRVMAEILPSLKGSAGKAQESLKKNLNETRKASKREDHVSELNG